MKFIENPNQPLVLERSTNAPDHVHVFDSDTIWALNTAMAAKRPLLVRGEPGVGKTQLAQAAAYVLRRPLITHVVDAQTEARDLLWQFDAVQRLAEAQVLGAAHSQEGELHARLSIERFTRPGPVWWALNWKSAEAQSSRLQLPTPDAPDGWKPGDGCVLLVDEIDKAESDVPNGLLQALGSARFIPEGFAKMVHAEGTVALVIVTTNEERSLPDAFLRRCLVHHITLPEDDHELVDLLVQRAEAHFPSTKLEVFKAAAEMLAADRKQAREHKVTPLPGQAEFLDLVRAVTQIAPDDETRQQQVLERVGKFVLDKNAGAR